MSARDFFAPYGIDLTDEQVEAIDSTGVPYWAILRIIQYGQVMSAKDMSEELYDNKLLTKIQLERTE